MINSRFSGNRSEEEGGAIKVTYAYTIDSLFDGNGGGVQGGSIAGRDTTVLASSFTGNRSATRCGAVSSASVSFADSSFIDNRAESEGGAVCATKLSINHASFIGNTAGDRGQSIVIAAHYYADSIIDITNSLFTTNPGSSANKAHCVIDPDADSSFTASGGNIERYENQTTGTDIAEAPSTLTRGLDSADGTALLLDRPLITTLTPVSIDDVIRYYEPQMDSPAIDYGNSQYSGDATYSNLPLRYDQRGPGYPRVQGSKEARYNVQGIIPWLFACTRIQAGYRRH